VKVLAINFLMTYFGKIPFISHLPKYVTPIYLRRTVVFRLYGGVGVTYLFGGDLFRIILILHSLIDKPLVFGVSIKSFGYSIRNMGGVQGSFTEIINIRRFICPCKQVVEIPHG